MKTVLSLFAAPLLLAACIPVWDSTVDRPAIVSHCASYCPSERKLAVDNCNLLFMAYWFTKAPRHTRMKEDGTEVTDYEVTPAMLAWYARCLDDTEKLSDYDGAYTFY